MLLSIFAGALFPLLKITCEALLGTPVSARLSRYGLRVGFPIVQNVQMYLLFRDCPNLKVSL